MQFYLDGYRPGDPFVQPPAPGVDDRPDGLPGRADVVVVGTGPAGMVLAAQLARFADLETLVVDRRSGPLEVGQADGVACRTVEVFEALGLADRLLAEAYWVNEVAFWRPDPADPDRIVRTGRVPDTEEGLSEFPHVIVNQARMLAWLREDLARQATRVPVHHGWSVTGVRVDPQDTTGYPVTVDLVGADGPASVRARYVVGCDGARSAVREAIGLELHGDRTDQRWGVMDVLPVTDFPDIRLKATVHSAGRGNVLVIPGRAGTWCGSTSSWTASPTPGRSTRPGSPRSPTGSCTPTPSRSATSVGGRSTRSGSGCATGSTTPRTTVPATRACSSQATPATPTAPRPARG